MLGDLGADVIQVEKPGGSPSRKIGPFYKDSPDPQRSLFWFAYNTNKRGITLNTETAEGQKILKRLVKTADFVIESSAPGYMEQLGLGYSALSQIKPSIIMVSITPFGQSGPKAHYKGSDLIAWASGGILYMCGNPDRPPNWVSFPQAYLHAAAEAAVGALIAHFHRQMTGEGQQVDVSVQDCVIPLLSHTPLFWQMSGLQFSRTGNYSVSRRGIKTRQTYPCKDGYIAVAITGGGSASHVASSRALVAWMDEEGVAPDWLKKLDWVNEYNAEEVTQELVDQVTAIATKFFATKTCSEIYNEAVRRGLLIAPFNSAQDIANSAQLQAR